MPCHMNVFKTQRNFSFQTFQGVRAKFNAWPLTFSIDIKGAFFCENPNPDFRIQKRILRFFGQIEKRNTNP